MTIDVLASICPKCNGQRYKGRLLCTCCDGNGLILREQYRVEYQKKPVHVTGKGLLLFFGWVLFYGLVIGGLIWWGNL